MRLENARACLLVASLMMAAAVPATAAAPIPPGRQHRATIQGENTITFLPQAMVPAFQVDYRARVEYIVDARLGKEKEPKAEAEEMPAKDEAVAKDEAPAKKAPAKKAGGKSAKTSARAGGKAAENPAAKVTGAIDLSLHSTEMTFRQKGQVVLESKVSRSKFQGRLQPEAPILSVSAKEAPPRLQEILKGYDTIAATLLLNDDFKVVGRKYRSEGPQRALIETLLSIHTPIPRDAESWESPTQLAMGHGQTAKGMLRFVKEKAKEPEKEKAKEKDGEARPADDLIRVKVSGVLKAEGAIAGNFIKDGTYTVTGEQTFDTHAREWVASRWSVAVDNELANQAGLTVARAKGTMTVESKAVEAAASAADEPKL